MTLNCSVLDAPWLSWARTVKSKVLPPSPFWGVQVSFPVLGSILALLPRGEVGREKVTVSPVGSGSVAFTDCEYRALDVISHYHHRHGYSFEEAMTVARPDYLILDETLEPVLQDDFGTAGDMIGYFALPRAEYERFLQERTTLVRLFTLPGYGTIQIWQVHWEAGT